MSELPSLLRWIDNIRIRRTGLLKLWFGCGLPIEIARCQRNQTVMSSPVYRPACMQMHSLLPRSLLSETLRAAFDSELRKRIGVWMMRVHLKSG